MSDGDGDGVGALEGVDPHDGLEVDGDELLHELHLRLHRLHAEVLHVAGKALVQPQVRPPRRGHQVAEPLKGVDSVLSFFITWYMLCCSADPGLVKTYVNKLATV